MDDALAFLALHLVPICSISPPGAHLCLMGYIFVPLFPTTSHRTQAPKCLHFAWSVRCCISNLVSSTCLVKQCPMRSAEWTCCIVSAGICLWPVPPKRKHCTCRSVPNTAAGLLDAAVLLMLYLQHTNDGNLSTISLCPHPPLRVNSQLIKSRLWNPGFSRFKWTWTQGQGTAETPKENCLEWYAGTLQYQLLSQG